VTTQQALDLAISHHQAGRLDQAQVLYQQILTSNPRDSNVLHLLGVATSQAGRFDEGAELIRRAIAINPNFAGFHFNLSETYRRQGKREQAIAELLLATQLDPKLPDAHRALSAALVDSGRFDEAVISAQKAIAIRPNFAEAHFDLGNALSGKGQFDAAIHSYRRAVELRPDLVDALINLGAACQQLRRFDEAIAALTRAIQLRPDSALAQDNLGVALQTRGQLDAAITAYHRAVQLSPNDSRFHTHLAYALEMKGHVDQAIAASAAAIRLMPSNAEAHATMALALKRKGLLDDAKNFCARALSLAPDLAEPHNTMGNILKDMGQVREAIAHFQLAVQRAPNEPAAHSNLLYTLYFDPRCSPTELLAQHRIWADRHAQPLKPLIRPHENDRDPNRRLRIGYVSPDFWGHAVGRFILPLLAAHDHKSFEIFCYASVDSPDTQTTRIQKQADVWRDIRALTDEEAAALIRKDRIEILIDLSMHMAGNRMLLFARKPAPVQATYLAYPGTTGLDTIDYRITDLYLDPPDSSDANYTERSLRLPQSYWCYESPATSPEINAPPAIQSGIVTFGCLNNFCKVTEPTLEVWTRLLARVPNSRLILHAAQGSHRDRVRQQFNQAGVTPERIIFIERLSLPEYLAKYREIDIALDPFPYVGGTTTCDALWMGVPVITLRGQTAVARGGVSILTNAGLSELIADSSDQYIQIAADLASDLPRLARLRSIIRDQLRASPLMDAPRFARDMEAAYRRIWQDFCATSPKPAGQIPSIPPDQSPDRLLALAISHHQAGRLAQAEELYKQILQNNPNHPDALHLSGMALAQTGRAAEGIELIQKAIAAMPDAALFHMSLGEAQRRVRNLDQAVASFTKATELDPELVEAHNNLSAALSDVRRFDDALSAAKKAVALRSGYAEAHFNLGYALSATNQKEAAIVSYRRAIELKPNYAEAHFNLGSVFQKLMRYDDAISEFSRAITLKPDFAEAYNNLGISLGNRGRSEDAVAAYTTAIRLNPNNPRSHSNLAHGLSQLARLDEAIAECDAAIRINPDFADAHANRASSLQEKGLLDEALKSISRAIALDPKPAESHNTMGNILKDMGRIEEAITCYRRAIERCPEDPAIHSNLLYTLYFDTHCTQSQLIAEHRAWAKQHANYVTPPAQTNDRNPNRRLRIGYVSPDFRAHPVGRFILPLLAAHDHAQFEIYCYASVQFHNTLTTLIQKHADVWRDIRTLNNEEAAKLIQSDRIDILIDLTMHMANNRMPLFARKPAPVQATYLAYPGTTGLETIDYRITDPHLDPPDSTDEFYSERSIRLAETYWCYEAPINAPDTNPLPALANNFITFGCLNNFCKNSPATLETWTRILAAVPNSRLLLHATDGTHRETVRQKFSNSGIDPTRLSFVNKMPMSDYMRQYHQIDIALDPFPYVGGTTTCDALWMGLPVITLRGQTAISRGGASILTNINLPELIANSTDEYIRIATTLAADQPQLTHLRSTLREKMRTSPLMDAPRFARNMETAYRKMWQTAVKL
jgi:protein O-GlcNAc transferase